MRTFLHVVVLFLVTLVPAFSLVYFLFGGILLVILGTSLVILWLLAILYGDKIVLAFLRSREVVSRDYALVSQVIKHESYKREEKIPSFYLYSGRTRSFFVLPGLNRWSIVIDRKLFSSLSDDMQKEFISCLFDYKSSLKSKSTVLSMSMIASCTGVIHYIFTKLFFLAERGVVYKSLSSFFLILILPLAILMEFLSRSSVRIGDYPSLKAFGYDRDDSMAERSFIYYFVAYLNDNITLRHLILTYLESYFVIEKENNHGKN